MIVALWIVLVLATLATVAACGWMLVRKFIALLAAVGELLVKPAILDGVHRGEPEQRPLPAVLEPRSVTRARYDAVTRARDERRFARNLARRERALALISSKPTGLN